MHPFGTTEFLTGRIISQRIAVGPRASQAEESRRLGYMRTSSLPQIIDSESSSRPALLQSATAA